MLIRSVKLHNIRSYLNEEIEFPQGSVLLSGDIGCGKSTILLAIEFALFGISKGLLASNALLRHGKQSGYVWLAFQLDGKEVTVQRTLKRVKDSIRQDEGYIIINGVKQFCTAEELKARVLGMLGYPKELLRKSKGLIYRFTVYTPQEDMKRILLEDPQARLDTLRRVFQVEKYKLVREGAAVVMQALREKKRELAARSELLPEKKRQLDDAIGRREDVDKRLALLAPKIVAAESALAGVQRALQVLEDKERQIGLMKAGLSAAVAVLAEKGSAIRSRQSEIALLKDDIARLDSQIEDNSGSLARLSSALSMLLSFSAALFATVEKKAGLDADLLFAEKLKSELDSEISKAEALMSSSEKVKQKVAMLAGCPTCLQPVSSDHKHKIAAEEDGRIASLSSAIALATSKQKASMQAISSLKSELAELQGREKIAAALTAELKQYVELASRLGVSVPRSEVSVEMPVAEMQAELATLACVRRRLEESRERMLMISEKERRFAIAVELVEGMKKEVAALELKKEEISAMIAGFGSVEQEVLQRKADLDRCVGERTVLLMQRASLEKEHEGVASVLAGLASEMERMEAAKSEMESSGNLNHWLEEIFLNLVSVIERHVMMKVHQEFNALFREWFMMMMGNETLSARIDEDFTPVVEENGFEIPVENLSGGEKTSCALAYRLSLNMVINNLVSTIRTKDMLILDEPTDGFSAEQLNKLRDVLASLNLRQVIIVSHEERIESFVQHVLRIAKEQHVSRIVAV